MKHCKGCQKEIPNRNYCSTCRNRQWDKNNPIRRAYRDTRNSAKRRGKTFTITYEYFEAWVIENRYMELKGTAPDDYSIDRIDDTKGYEPGNLQLLTNRENTKKQRDRESYLRSLTTIDVTGIVPEVIPSDEEAPF